ncbi:unnamed protein product [Psylliodes chrysocephalus]|uniref:Uncharacterized protein n=1 Tax=Psylliodes chrysocephalus TaxID=3402493 RepID=A0A9P0GCM9_9CUCU|nr:unnamed protein product [Psylliodes chrysocephala]
MITDENVAEIPVCYKAFLSLYSIRKKIVKVLQKSLKMTGKAPTGIREKHFNRPQNLKPDAKQLVLEHISSFKWRQSHYSLKDSTEMYLSEEINIKKMYNMYKGINKDQQYTVSYETYISIFSQVYHLATREVTPAVYAIYTCQKERL